MHDTEAAIATQPISTREWDAQLLESRGFNRCFFPPQDRVQCAFVHDKFEIELRGTLSPTPEGG